MKFKEKHIQISMVIITLVMTILRFLLNEKGRLNPDSIRYMRAAHVFPIIDNTTTPLGYPLSIKFFTFFGFDEFWSSKAVGIAAFLFIIIFAWKKKFYFRETIILSALFSFLSIYSYTMSEALILPFVFLFLYTAMLVITGKLEKWKAVFYLSLALIALYNIRYSALFIIAGTGLYGLIFWKRKYSFSFIISAAISCVFIVLYKFFFIMQIMSKHFWKWGSTLLLSCWLSYSKGYVQHLIRLFTLQIREEEKLIILFTELDL